MGNIFVDLSENAIYPTDNFPRRTRGIYLQHHELQVLEQIYQHRILDSVSIHNLFRFYKPAISTQVITNRLSRFLECSLLIRKEIPNPYGLLYNRYCYTLSKRGYEVLEVAEMIPVGTSEVDKETVRPPNEHNQFAISTMIELTCNLQNKYPFSFSRGIIHEVYQNKVLKNASIPDYILEYKNNFLCVEFDMNTENLKVITNKTKSYMQLYQNGFFGALKPILIFVIKENGEGNRPTKRIQNIKSAHNELYEQLAQLPVYVVSESDFLPIVELLLQKKYPIQPNVQEIIQSEVVIFEQAKYNRLRGWKFNFIPTEELIEEKEFLQTLQNSPSTNVQYVTYRDSIKTAVHLTAEYGNVFSFLSVLRYVDILADASNRLYAQAYLPVEVKVTYPYISNEQLSIERLGVMPHVPLSLMAEQEMIQAQAAILAAEDEFMLNDAYRSTNYI